MAYPENKPSLGFTQINTHNLNTLGLADISIYPSTFTIVNPTYQIFPPGFPSASVAYSPTGVNIYNSNNLNITCVVDSNLLNPLPDGIYKIIQSINPVLEYQNEKTFIRIESLKYEFGKAFMHVEMGCDVYSKDTSLKILYQIYAYVEGAIAAANQCNTILAMDLYRLAQRTLKNFLKGNSELVQTRTNWY
jgi:hypothetical protein